MVEAVNFMGPKTDPCGTLQSTDCGSDCCVDADSQRSFKEVQLTPVKCCIFDSETVT